MPETVRNKPIGGGHREPVAGTSELTNENDNPLQIDEITRTLVTTSFEHHEVHEGDMFQYCTFDADLDDGATIALIFTTPDTPQISHFLWEVSGALTTLVQFFENTPRAVDGAALVAFNKNRNSANLPETTVHNAAAGLNGTQIDCASFGIDTGVGANRISGGGSGRGTQEWPLKRDTQYLLLVTSGVDNNNVTVKGIWYEHTSKTN